MMKIGNQLGGLLTLAISLSITVPSHAQTVIYKWVDKDGVVSFSQNEPTEKEARDVTSITVQEMPMAQQRAANRLLVDIDKNEDASFAAHQKRIQQNDEQVQAALTNLEKAERELSQGSIPTGFDRVGNVNGRARLRESYFERVSELQEKVDKARQDLNDAYNARDQLNPD